MQRYTEFTLLLHKARTSNARVLIRVFQKADVKWRLKQQIATRMAQLHSLLHSGLDPVICSIIIFEKSRLTMIMF